MKAEDLSCREALDQDYWAVHELKSECGIGYKDSHEGWRRAFAENPALDADRGHWPIGWVLTRAGKIVGCLGNMPQAYVRRGRRLMAAVCVGLAVAPAWRRHTYLLLGRYLKQQADLFLSTTSGEGSAKLWPPLKFARVPEPHVSQTKMFVPSYTCFVAAGLRGKNLPGWTVALAARPLAAALKAMRRWRGTGIRPSDRVRRIDRFDDRFDRLWTQLAADGERLMAVRDRATLSWHFDEPLRSAGGAVIVREDAQGGLTGYAVLVGDPRPPAGHRVYRLADLQAADGDRAVLAGLLQDAFRVCLDDGADALVSVGFPQPWHECMDKFDPFVRQTNAAFYFKAADPALHEALLDQREWFACLYDGDNILL